MIERSFAARAPIGFAPSAEPTIATIWLTESVVALHMVEDVDGLEGARFARVAPDEPIQASVPPDDGNSGFMRIRRTRRSRSWTMKR